VENARGHGRNPNGILGLPCREHFTLTEPPKSLGPPTVVLVQRTSDNPAGAPDHLTSSVSKFLTFPRAFHPSRRHYNSSEIRKCRSSYNNLLLLKSKTKLYSYRPEHNIWVLSIIITNHGRQNSSRISSKKFLTEGLSSHSFSLGSLPLVPPLNRSNKSLLLLHLKQHGTKPWVRRVLSQDLLDKVKDSQGYAVFKGVKVRLINNQWLCL
jgi:hypothetical protein